MRQDVKSPLLENREKWGTHVSSEKILQKAQDDRGLARIILIPSG